MYKPTLRQVCFKGPTFSLPVPFHKWPTHTHSSPMSNRIICIVTHRHWKLLNWPNLTRLCKWRDTQPRTLIQYDTMHSLLLVTAQNEISKLRFVIIAR